ncbi:MAG: OmpA family protein [Gemmatimonadetes bacterium]|nr:OmpA family protein [Gemmatimonadota bacterium]
MPDKDSPTVIRVYKKKAKAHGHHGGAWKVAYADFVTAMMAFFLVMWLISMQPDVKDAVQGYFNNPIGFKTAYSSGDNPVFESSPAAATLQFLSNARRRGERERLQGTADRIREEINSSPDLEAFEGDVSIVVDGDGLRIELMEAAGGSTFFESGASVPRAELVEALRIVADELIQLAHPIVIEGHTDARPLDRRSYTNWELSTDRAHAARRLLETFDLRASRFLEVRGYADRRLRDPRNPTDPSNRRVSILLPFQSDLR